MTRHAIAAFALVFLAACNSGTSSQDAATAPAGAGGSSNYVPAAASAPNADDQAIAAEAQGIVAEAAAQAQTAPPPVAGVDYTVIQDGQPFQPTPGKVEVVEVFGYVCPACYGFQPIVEAWKQSLPADVQLHYLPANFGGVWDTYAQAFYAAQALGVQDDAHNAVYRAIHVDRSLKGERGADKPEEIAAFYGHYGVDPKQFQDTMQSFAVQSNMNRGKQFAMRSQVQATPTLVINGKYLVQGDTRADQLRIANQLIAMEREAMPAADAQAPAAAPAGVPATEAAPGAEAASSSADAPAATQPAAAPDAATPPPAQ